MGVGNVYRHDYDNVQHDFVWRTVQERLPALLAVIEEEIALATPHEPISEVAEPYALLEIEPQAHPEEPDMEP
jgi:hypothetical protein